jgi:hypothetical protein
MQSRLLRMIFRRRLVMAFNPVPGIGPADPTQSAAADQRVSATQAPASTTEHSSASDSGTSSESETNRPSSASLSNQLPQDEVQLLRDQQTNGDIVIKYLDGSGNVVLQVPSSQVLGVSRSIIQEFAAEAARTREDTASPKEVSRKEVFSGSNGGNHGH